MQFFLKLSPSDTVAVATKNIPSGQTVSIENITLQSRSDIPCGHKIALCAIPKGEPIIKYGYPIGVAKENIAAGEWVHTHNVATALEGEGHYAYRPAPCTLPAKSDEAFMGYRRANGKAAVRNEIWIIPTVGCVNNIAIELATYFSDDLPENIDGVYAYTHPYGCSQIGDDHQNTRKLLSSLCNHPNAGGVLLLGLGCENNQLEDMLPLIDNDRLQTLICQQTEDEIQVGKEKIQRLIDSCKNDKRQPIPVSELIIGLKCGGSDAFSGITANPLVGAFSDMLVRRGGTTILTEVPEMFGAEIPLLSHCKNLAVYDRAVQMIEDFKEYYRRSGQPIYENPSPGNKAGGITTLEDKSLGCTQKAGSGQITSVLRYGETVTENGVALLCAPGNDLVATTALAAAGAHIVLFTTGRGTPFAGPVPTVKISSNSALGSFKNNWIDYNAGEILEGTTIEKSAERFYHYIISLSEGKCKTKSEARGARELAIFKTGVTL